MFEGRQAHKARTTMHRMTPKLTIVQKNRITLHIVGYASSVKNMNRYIFETVRL